MSIVSIVGTVIGMGVFGSLLSTVRPINNWLNQQIASVWPNELLPPANLINLRYRGHVDDTTYFDEMAKQGLNKDRAESVYKGSEMLLNGYEIISIWRRGVLTEDERDIQLGELGFTPERIPLLASVTAQIPSALDVISFAVREVYSPEIVSQFGQMEGVEEVLSVAEADITASGMTPETFKKYWAAHWHLPSMMQAYEMLHRDVIDTDTLNSLMVALDIMPFWRDKLRAISYAPYTRVDVRRMHKLGIIGKDELIRAYMDLGYDEERAKGLADFTVVYNQAPEAQEVTEIDIQKTKEKEATRAVVVTALKSRIIEEDEAREHLAALDYTNEAVDLFMANAQFDLEEGILSEIVETIHIAYTRRIYDFSTTIAKLGELNLPAKQSEALLDKWQIELEAKTSRPSKAELFKLWKGKIINEEELTAELEGHGYTKKYISWYLSLEGKK